MMKQNDMTKQRAIAGRGSQAGQSGLMEKSGLVRLLASASLLAVTIIWGSAFVVMKHSIDVISPSYLLAYRFTVAALGMTVLFWRSIKTMSRREFQCGLVVGALLFISYYFQTYGLKYTTASKNAFITTLYVILVPFLQWLFHRIRPAGRNLAAAVIAVIGLALLSLKGDLSVNFGDFLTLICGVCFAVHIIYLEKYTEEVSPIKLTVMQMGTAAALAWITALATEGRCDLSVYAQTGEPGAVLYLGLASSMLGFLLQTVGQKYLDAATASILLSFESVFGLIFSVLFLKEPVTLKMLAGCALMFSAAILAEYTPGKRQEGNDPAA